MEIPKFKFQCGDEKIELSIEGVLMLQNAAGWYIYEHNRLITQSPIGEQGQ